MIPIFGLTHKEKPCLVQGLCRCSTKYLQTKTPRWIILMLACVGYRASNDHKGLFHKCIIYDRRQKVYCFGKIRQVYSVTRKTYQNPRQCLGCQCELFVVCVYVFCFYGQETPTLRLSHCRAVHSVTLCPVESISGPSETFCSQSRFHSNLMVFDASFDGYKMFMVDLGGFAPPSRTLFSLLHTAITFKKVRQAFEVLLLCLDQL